MRKAYVRLTLLSLAAALIMSSLPLFTDSAAANAAQARRTTRRRTTARGPVLVPLGTNLRVRLNDDLSSKDSRVSDHFTATVVNPTRFEGATLRGHISRLQRSGTVTGRTTMTLAFDSVALHDGRTGTLRGQVVRIYDADSDSSKVDEEGRVQSGSRGKQAVKRGGIGAVAGAIIGGIAGGGKGAAIGLLVGGAAGAGSLAVQGKKELKIERGTEMLVRVTR
jgi:outer membrane lipoprotein SlyB